MKISKRMKIAGIITAIVLIAFLAFMAYVGSDALSSQATSSELLTPDGAATGRALVVYNPGLSGAPEEAAKGIANDLKAKGYDVMLAGVKSPAAANVSGYDLIIAGGPIYGGKVSPSIDSYLRTMVPLAGTKVGAFAIGTGSHKSFPDATWLKATVLFPTGNGIGQQQAEFEAELMK